MYHKRLSKALQTDAWVQCRTESCSNWHHVTCCGIANDRFGEIDADWICRVCVQAELDDLFHLEDPPALTFDPTTMPSQKSKAFPNSPMAFRCNCPYALFWYLPCVCMLAVSHFLKAPIHICMFGELWKKVDVVKEMALPDVFLSASKESLSFPSVLKRNMADSTQDRSGMASVQPYEIAASQVQELKFVAKVVLNELQEVQLLDVVHVQVGDQRIPIELTEAQRDVIQNPPPTAPIFPMIRGRKPHRMLQKSGSSGCGGRSMISLQEQQTQEVNTAREDATIAENEKKKQKVERTCGRCGRKGHMQKTCSQCTKCKLWHGRNDTC